MNYDILNQVYEEIIVIVNSYVRRTNCSYEVARKLSFALFGYYLVFGESIFEKLNIVLDGVNIYETVNDEDYFNTIRNIRPDTSRSSLGYNPITMWDYKYDEKNRFLGGIPNIIYMRGNDISNVLSISHEISHVLEGTGASVTSENDKRVFIEQGFAKLEVDKESNKFKNENNGFIELCSIAVESRIASSFAKLDASKLNSPLLKEFVRGFDKYKGKNIMSRAYETLGGAFKDLIDNDVFMNLIGKYFYDNNEALFIAEFSAIDPRLKYWSIKRCALNLKDFSFEDLDNIMKNIELLKEQIRIFNEATSFVPDDKLLILV